MVAMRKQWAPLLVWSFKGARFDEDGLDLRDLEELTRLRALLVELAKDIRRKEPSTKQAPPGSVELRFFGTERGSCIVPVFYAPTQPRQPALFPEATDDRTLTAKLPEAAKLIQQAIEYARAESGRVPPTFPRELTRQLFELGKGLGSGESFSVALPALVQPTPISVDVYESPDRETLAAVARTAGPAVVGNAAVRRAIETAFAAKSVERQTLTGEVTMASVRGQAILSVNGRGIELRFDSTREHEITRALHEHATTRLRARGLCDLDDRGRVTRMQVEDFRLVPPRADTDEERFAKMAVEAPEELLAILRDATLPSTSLTFAAEAAGRLASSGTATALLELLRSPSPIVREGVVYGLAGHLGADGVKAALGNRAATDVSPGVRAAAAAVLEEGA